MAILLNEILKSIDKLAPFALAEEWDNVGLQAGSRGATIGSALLSLNLTDEVISEAVELGCDLIITHHPLIFSPLRSVSEDDETGRLITRLQREGIAAVAAHTNLDSAPGGLAHILAEMLGLGNVRPLVGAPSDWSKLTVFVPPNRLAPLRAAIFDIGGGIIGDYQHCSWSTVGEGTFLPTEGATPAVGYVGKEERTEEVRLEMVIPSSMIEQAIDRIIRTHPYEEPAYDIYPLETRRRDAGIGRVGDFDAEMSLGDVAASVAELHGLERVSFTGDPGRHIRRVAVAPGSGAGLVSAAAQQNAEMLITGDFKYHDSFHAARAGLSLISVPHDVSEKTALESWLAVLGKELRGAIGLHFSQVPTDLWQEAGRRERNAVSDAEEMTMNHLHVDGGSRGNPGPAGIGAVLMAPDGKKLDELSAFIGDATNNVAEYQALIAGIEMALDRGIRRLAIFSDSELIVRQIEGKYQVKNEGLRPYHQDAKMLLARLEEYEIRSVPRESNAKADRLVNQALDKALK